MAKGKSKGGGATKSVSERSYDLAAKNPDYIGDGFGYDAKTINAYTQEGYYVNRKIMEGALDTQDKAFIKNLDLALSKLPTSPKQELFRGVNLPNSIFDNLKIGGVIEFPAFTSTSVNKGIAKSIISLTRGSLIMPTIFNITSHKNGKDITSISNHENEKEILFKRGTKWKITSINGNEVNIQEL